MVSGNEQYLSEQGDEDRLRIARLVAARLTRRYRWVDRDDLDSYAYLGVRLAERHYDPLRGIDFAKFASFKGQYLAIDEMRKDGLLRRMGDSRPGISNGPVAEDLPDASSDQSCHRLEARELCASLLKSLEGDDRRLMLMYYTDEMTFREIASVMGISESAVCLRHKSILGKLQRLVASQGLTH